MVLAVERTAIVETAYWGLIYRQHVWRSDLKPWLRLRYLSGTRHYNIKESDEKEVLSYIWRVIDKSNNAQTLVLAWKICAAVHHSKLLQARHHLLAEHHQSGAAQGPWPGKG